MDHATLNLQQPDARRNPDLSIVLLADGGDGGDGEVPSSVEPLQPVLCEPEEPTVRAYPQGSAGILIESAHESIGQPITRPECAKRAVAVPQQAASFEPDPKRAVDGGAQGQDAIVVEGGR